MRVLVVDHDSALLTAITRLLGDYFPVDAVTTKSDCLDLLRANEYDVIVAGERLEDGSGLELLSQTARSCPDMLRLFAADPERLKLLKGRLGPFGLFRTLYYPIEPRQLLAALSAAAGIEDEEEPEEPAPPPMTPQLQTPTRVSAVVTTAAARHRATSATATAAPPAPRPPPSGQQSRSGGAPRNNNRDGSRSRGSRQPTPEALALGARLAAASRMKGFPPPSLEASAKRSTFVVGAGLALVVGALFLTFRIFSPQALHTANLASAQPNYPPEVLKLVADTENAFQEDDLRTVRTDIAALQQIAPTHPALPSFEAQLARHQTAAAAEARRKPEAAGDAMPRHAPVPKTARPTTSQARRKPAAGGTTFSGKTVEDSSADPR